MMAIVVTPQAELTFFCPYCHGELTKMFCSADGEECCTYPLIEDGDLIPSIDLHNDVESQPCYYALCISICSLCKRTSWLVSAAFAAQRHLDTKILARMQFNVDPGQVSYYTCSRENGLSKWNMLEYKENGKNPFQWHLLGPFTFFTEESSVVGEYGVALCERSKEANEWDLAGKMLTSLWSDYCILAGTRDN